MNGDAPDGSGVEVPQRSPIETGQAQPVVPEVPQLPPAEAGLVDELSDTQSTPIDIIREAAENYPDEDLTSDNQALVDQAAADVSAAVNGSDPLTYSPDKPPALIDPDKDQGPSKKNFKDGYATGKEIRMASDEDARPGIYEPDDSPDVPVSDQERADGFRDAAEAKASSEASNEDIAEEGPVELTDEQFADSFADEKYSLQTIPPEDPKYDAAQRRIREIDAFSDFVRSDKASIGNTPRAEAMTQLRKEMIDRSMQVRFGGEVAVTPAAETPVQEATPANSAEQPVQVEPISDDQLAAELAYLKAESGNDVEHPLGRRIRAINNFNAVRNSDKSTINGMPKEEAVRQMREELTKGAVEVPKPAAPTAEEALGSDTPSLEQPLSDLNPVDTSTGNAELDKLRAHLRDLTSEGEPTGIGPESEANYTREQIAKLEANLASGGAENKAEPAVAEEPAAENPAIGEVPPTVDSDDASADVDPETQRRIEMGNELRMKVEAMRDSLSQGKEEGEELSPLESAKLEALNIDLGILSYQIESSRISDSQIRIMSSKVEAYMQADSNEEIDAIRFPGEFEATLQAEAQKLTEQAKSEPDNATIADRLSKIKEFNNLPWFSQIPEEAQQRIELRKELLIPFDTGASGDEPEGVEVPLPTGPGTSVEVDDDKAQELVREKDKLIVRTENTVRRLRYDVSDLSDDSEELKQLKQAKIDELQSELDFLAHITRDGNFHEDDLRTSSQRVDLYTQADSMAEIDAIRYPGDFELRLEAEANVLAQKLNNDPDNRALADRLSKINEFLRHPMYPRDPELVSKQAARRKELVIPFDSGATAEVGMDEPDDEGFMPTVRVPGTAAPKSSLRSKIKEGFSRGMEYVRGARRARGATEEPAPTDSGPLPAWLTTEPPSSETPPMRWSRPVEPEPPRATSKAIEPPAPTVTVPSPDVVPLTPAPEPAVEPPAPSPVVEPAPAPRANSEQRLASMNLDKGLPITRAQAIEGQRLLRERDEAIKLDKLGAIQRTPSQEVEFKRLEREFPAALAADRKAREQAVTPVYSADQSELKRLRELRDTDKLPGDQLGRLDELETAESRYKLLSEKEKMTASEQKELDEMGDTWKDPALRAKEQEILDLADVSLESSADFAKFAEALQEYALRKQGKFHPALEAGIRMAVQEYFNRPDSGLTKPERDAMEQIQKLVKGMQQEIATLMTYKKSIEAQFDKQKQIVEQIKVSNKLVGGDMRSDDRTKQEEAHRLTQLYLQLASTNSVIRITKRRAEDANYNFQWRHRKVRKELGVQSLKDTMLGTWDDINRVFRFASRNFGLETDPVLSVRNKKLERP